MKKVVGYNLKKSKSEKQFPWLQHESPPFGETEQLDARA